jgi:tetratricopeptide (TPR) repeat protein
MFGTAHPDQGFFRKFPITHLLLDDGNIVRLSEDYPDVMKFHEHVCTYFVGETKVRLVNVAAATGDTTASRYVRTGLEQAIIAFRNQDTAVARREIVRFAQAHPFNIAGNLLLFEMANAEGRFEIAESALKKAVEFSPTSYVLNARLGRFYRDRSRASGSSELHELAARYYEQAVYLAPTAERTVDEYQRFKDESK